MMSCPTIRHPLGTLPPIIFPVIDHTHAALKAAHSQFVDQFPSRPTRAQPPQVRFCRCLGLHQGFSRRGSKATTSNEGGVCPLMWALAALARSSLPPGTAASVALRGLLGTPRPPDRRVQPSMKSITGGRGRMRNQGRPGEGACGSGILIDFAALLSTGWSLHDGKRGGAQRKSSAPRAVGGGASGVEPSHSSCPRHTPPSALMHLGAGRGVDTVDLLKVLGRTVGAVWGAGGDIRAGKGWG
jgi:hypothetical protein